MLFRSEDFFGACLSLNLLSGAAYAATRAMVTPQGGAYRRYAGRLMAWILSLLAVVLGVVERMRACKVR